MSIQPTRKGEAIVFSIFNRREAWLSTLATSIAIQNNAFVFANNNAIMPARLRQSVCRAPFAKIPMVIELLNSKVNHADLCEIILFGVALCEKLDQPSFRILYDIYHMQIMEGNLNATIKENHQWFAHYHTAGVPGRHEIDDTQEIHYPMVVKTILETGYREFIAQEFSPTRPDKIGLLKQAVEICSKTLPL